MKTTLAAENQKVAPHLDDQTCVMWAVASYSVWKAEKETTPKHDSYEGHKK